MALLLLFCYPWDSVPSVQFLFFISALSSRVCTNFSCQLSFTDLQITKHADRTSHCFYSDLSIKPQKLLGISYHKGILFIDI